MFEILALSEEVVSLFHEFCNGFNFLALLPRIIDMGSLLSQKKNFFFCA